MTWGSTFSNKHRPRQLPLHPYFGVVVDGHLQQHRPPCQGRHSDLLGDCDRNPEPRERQLPTADGMMDVFRRERVFWVERDERIDVVDPARVEGELERFLLSAIARAL